MATMLKTLWKLRDIIILLCTPVLLLPLPILWRTTEANCAYVITLVAVYWCTEALPLAITSLLPAVLYPIFGIMTSKQVCMQYLMDTNMMFMGGLVVAVAVEHWNLHKRIALKVLLIMGVRPALLMLGFMGVTAFLSMWISNTATTAMMLPIVNAVLEQMNSSEAGMPHILNVDKSVQSPEEEDKETEIEQEESVTALEESKEEAAERNRMCKGMTLCVCYAASIGGTATLTGTGPNLVLKGQVNQLFPQNGEVINFASWFAFAFPNMILMLSLGWLWLQYLFLGFDLRKSWCCGASSKEKDDVVYKFIREQYQHLGPMCFGELSVLVLFSLMVVLWFTRDPGFVGGWATQFFNTSGEYVTDATVAIFVAVLLFIFPSRAPCLCCRRSDDSESSSNPWPPILTWTTVQTKMPWHIVLLLGGGFALAKGCEVSGLSKWLGNQMMPLQGMSPWVISCILCVVIATFTECASNSATATVFLPILATLSKAIGINPLYVMVPCTLSASFAFMLPVATPPNAIVFSYGYLKVSDMARAGIVMNIISLLCVILATNSWGRNIFKLDTFPAWANGSVV